MSSYYDCTQSLRLVSLSFEKFSQRLGHHIPPGQKFNLVKLSSQNFLQKLKGTISHIIWISFLCKQISTINSEHLGIMFHRSYFLSIFLVFSDKLRRVKNGVLSYTKLLCAIIFLIPSLQ